MDNNSGYHPLWACRNWWRWYGRGWHRQSAIPRFAAFNGGAIMCLLGVATIYNCHTVVKHDGIRVKILHLTRKYRWGEISNIIVPPYSGWLPFVGFSIVIIPKQVQGKRRFNAPVPTVFFSNRHLVAKAIVEAASAANPNIMIDLVLIDAYGPPPYGIFYEKKLEMKTKRRGRRRVG